ncbi:hypothetical protein ACVMFB_006341 [Bradyrhizobium sp. USDA 4522]
MNQPGIEARLELRDRLADPGLRHAEPFGGPAKTARIRQRREDHQAANQPTVNFVHADAFQSSKR